MSRYQKLFDYFYQEHNIILLEQEMQEVINFVNEMQERDRIAGELSGSGEICDNGKKHELTIREQKLETIVKLFAKSMFYGNWKWETPNERVIEMLMREVDLYPFQTEDAMILSTKVDDELYKRALTEVPSPPTK